MTSAQQPKRRKLTVALLLLLGFGLVMGLWAWSQSSPVVVDHQASTKLCGGYSGLPTANPENPARAGMVWVAGGRFKIGNDIGFKEPASNRYEPYPEERGAHEVELPGFWMDAHEVTNAQYKAFVDATGYVTLAERPPQPKWYPAGTSTADMQSGSAVFGVFSQSLQSAKQALQRWSFVKNANWRQPQGEGSSIADSMNRPVVHIAYEDAMAYAEWAGRALPTEAQWEFAALHPQVGNHDNVRELEGQWQSNTWQGVFPLHNNASDGFKGVAPVGCFPPNALGIYDLIGNVWELLADDYQSGHHSKLLFSDAAKRQAQQTAKVIKGGSYLCAPNFCMRYRPAARQPQDPTMGTSHVGFRTVLNIDASQR